MRQVSLLMASSRVMTLGDLLLVITAGIYLLRLDLLGDVLILASAVLLARLDLPRVGVLPAPFASMLALSFWCSVVLAWVTCFNPTADWFTKAVIAL